MEKFKQYLEKTAFIDALMGMLGQVPDLLSQAGSYAGNYLTNTVPTFWKTLIPELTPFSGKPIGENSLFHPLAEQARDFSESITGAPRALSQGIMSAGPLATIPMMLGGSLAMQGLMRSRMAKQQQRAAEQQMSQMQDPGFQGILNSLKKVNFMKPISALLGGLATNYGARKMGVQDPISRLLLALGGAGAGFMGPNILKSGIIRRAQGLSPLQQQTIQRV